MPHPAQLRPRARLHIGFLAFQGVEPGKIQAALWSKYAILTATMAHEEYTGLRITPNVYTSLRDIDTFCDMVERELAA